MRVSKTILALIACLGLGAVESGAQILGGQPVAPKLVQLNVVALDSHGQPVGDLTAADFHITDAGKQQEVSLFRHSENKLQQQIPLRPGEFSNRNAENVPHATLILFDLFNEGFGARGAAENYLVHGLQSLESDSYLCLSLLTQDARLYPVHPLPGEGSEPAETNGGPWTKESKGLIDQALGKVYRLRPVEIDIDTRVRMTYRALEETALHLAGIPGRKNIVWITHGVPISLGPGAAFSDGADYTPLLRQLTITLNRIGVAIYPVQQVPPGMASEGSPESRYSGMGSQETLQQFANLTGGAMKSGGDIETAVRQAMSDVRTSYLLGYYPPPANWDGKFHKLRVACARKGIRIQTVSGYYAWDDAVSEQQEALDSAALSSFDASEIGLRGTMTPIGNGRPAGRFSYRIDPADIRFVEDSGRFSAHLALQLIGYSPDGKGKRTQIIPVDLNLNAGEHTAMLRDGIPFSYELALEGGFNKVRLIVFDQSAHTVGSLTIPVAQK